MEHTEAAAPQEQKQPKKRSKKAQPAPKVWYTLRDGKPVEVSA